jgi:glutamyl-tRNA reductase
MSEALIALNDYEAIREAAMVSTCGRLEIYTELHELEAGIAQLKAFLGNFRHGSLGYDIDPYLYTLIGTAATEHLFRVTTGLDSMLIGEAEILGQVKEAYNQAQHARSIGPVLHKLFRDALNAGKAARAQTAIGGESVSIATAAIEMAKEHVGGLRGKKILLIGAGKMGQTAAKRLKLEGAETIVVMNRTHQRARDLVQRLGVGETAELPSLAEELAKADIVITSTGASHFVLSAGTVAEAMIVRPMQPLFIIDIAVPRDVDPVAARIPGVKVTDVDQLGAAIDVTIEHRREAVPLVEEIIGEHVAGFAAWYEARMTVPVIATLAQKAEAIRESETDRLFARCPEFSDREKMLVTGMSLRVVSRLLHTVIAKIREKSTTSEAAALAHVRLVDELFDLHLGELAMQAALDGYTPEEEHDDGRPEHTGTLAGADLA